MVTTEIGPPDPDVNSPTGLAPVIPANAYREHSSGESSADSKVWRHGALVDAVDAWVGAGVGPVVLCGLPGMGKTVAMADAADEISQGRRVLAFRLSGRQPDPSYLVQESCRFFGVKARRRAFRSPWPAALRQLLASRPGGGLIVLIDAVDPGWAAADVIAFWSQVPDTVVMATARTYPPQALLCHVIHVRSLSRAESLSLIQHQMAQLTLSGDPERITQALSADILSHPQTLCALLAHLQGTPIGLLLSAPDLPADVRQSLQQISGVVSAVPAEDRRSLAFAVILNGAKLTDVRAAGLTLPEGFSAALVRLARNCLLSASDDSVEVSELIAAVLADAEPSRLVEAERVVVSGLCAANASSVPGIDAALAHVLPPVAAELVKIGSWAAVGQLIDPALLDRLNVRGYWEAYVQLTRMRVEAADHLGESAEQVIMRCRLARKLAQQGDLDSAWDLLHEAQDAADDEGPAALRAMLCQHRAMLAYLQNDDRSALADTRASAALYADAADAAGVLEARKLEANILLRQGDYQGAADTYQKALVAGSVPVSLKHRLEVETSLALCEMRLGIDDKAEQRLERIFRQIRESGINSELPRALLVSALLAEQRGRFADSLQFARRAAAEPAPDAAVRMAAERLAWRLERFGRDTAAGSGTKGAGPDEEK